VDTQATGSDDALTADAGDSSLPDSAAQRLGLTEIDRSGAKSVAAAVLEAIRQAIVVGQLEAGHRYFENELAAELGVSRTPVREAVRSLAAQGLVVNAEGRRGFVVVDPRQDVAVVYEIRKGLEGLAARLAADHITVPQLQNLDATLEAMLSLIDADNVEENRDRIAELNNAFHTAINEASGSARLVTLIEQLAPIYRSRRLVRFYSAETLRNSHASHQAILRALWTRDGELADQLTRGHINHGQQFTLTDEDD
jgi:DNA-binding GntR family transcriptional regulator